MKKDCQNQSEHKYLTYCMIAGLPIGAAIAVIAAMLLHQNIGMFFAIGAGVGMMLGIVVGTTIDFEIQKKSEKSNANE